MAEQKAENQKLGIVKRIFKWIGLGLLVLLLIAALIFQAPWKVITLLIIILLACTILPRPARKWFWLSAAAVIIALIIWVFLPDDNEGWRPYTFDEELAALEAARSIPDTENAATIYNQLLENYGESSLSLNFLDDETDNLTSREPWLSKDYPELAEWLKGHQSTIETLIKASKIEKCRFPIAIDPVQRSQPSQPYRAMRQWTFLLRRAANNDIAEGRLDDALEKYLCLNQMGNHLCQQPVMVDYLVGIAVEAIALGGMKTFILEGDATEKHLKTIEAALPHTKDNWAEISSKILEFETLYERKNVGLFDRLKFAWQGMRVEDTFERIHEIYLRLLADRHGNRILIALRRYKNKHGHWPQTLSEIQSFVPAEILIDPLNEGSFVYKPTDDTFKLHSKGLNNIDDDGKRDQWGRKKTGADDRLIWPTYYQKIKTKKENADAEQQ